MVVENNKELQANSMFGAEVNPMFAWNLKLLPVQSHLLGSTWIVPSGGEVCPLFSDLQGAQKNQTKAKPCYAGEERREQKHLKGR